MAANVFDPIEIYVGDTAHLPVTFLRADNSTPVDLTGASVSAKCTRGTGGGETLWSKSIGSGITVTGSGAVAVSIGASDTAIPGRFSLSVRCVESDGTTTTTSGLLIIKDHALG